MKPMTKETKKKIIAIISFPILYSALNYFRGTFSIFTTAVSFILFAFFYLLC